MNDGLVLLGQVLVGVLTLAGVIVTARQGRKAQEKATAVQQGATVVTGYDQLVTQMRRELDRLAPLPGKVHDLEESVGRLEAKLGAVTRRYRAAIRYIRALRLFIARHLPAELGAMMPPPPEELLADMDS